MWHSQPVINSCTCSGGHARILSSELRAHGSERQVPRTDRALASFRSSESPRAPPERKRSDEDQPIITFIDLSAGGGGSRINRSGHETECHGLREPWETSHHRHLITPTTESEHRTGTCDGDRERSTGNTGRNPREINHRSTGDQRSDAARSRCRGESVRLLVIHQVVIIINVLLLKWPILMYHYYIVQYRCINIIIIIITNRNASILLLSVLIHDHYVNWSL